MATPSVFVRDAGIYGKKEFPAFETRFGFMIFKDEKEWTVGQKRSGLAVAGLIPKNVRRTKKALIDYIEAMEAALPEACAMVSLADGAPMHKDLLPYGRQLVQFFQDWPR